MCSQNFRTCSFLQFIATAETLILRRYISESLLSSETIFRVNLLFFVYIAIPHIWRGWTALPSNTSRLDDMVKRANSFSLESRRTMTRNFSTMSSSSDSMALQLVVWEMRHTLECAASTLSVTPLMCSSSRNASNDREFFV